MSHPITAPDAETSPKAARAQLTAWAKPKARDMTLTAILGLLEAACAAGFAWGVSHLVTSLWAGGKNPNLILFVILITISSITLKGMIYVFNQKLSFKISRELIQIIRYDIFGKAIAERLHSGMHSGQFGALFEDTEALEGYYARFTQATFQAGVVPLVMIAVVATQSLVCAALLGLTLLPFVALMALLGLSSAAESRRQLDALSRLSNLFSDRVRAMLLILSFDNGPRQAKALGRAAQDVARRTLRVLKLAFMTSAVLEFFSALSIALIAVYCGFSLLGELPFKAPETLTFPAAFFVLALSPEIYAPIRRLSAAYHDRQTALAAAQRLIALQTASEPTSPPRLSGPPEIVFDDVTLGFSDDPDFRIGPATFTAAPGSVTALTGPTGAGKTTLLRVPLGQGQVTGGDIRINGTPMADLTADIAWVSQNPPILAGTLYDNLVLANRAADPAAIERAINLVGLRDVVEARGLHAPLDERGSGLSGGERRRIGLARAVLKDAPILLLDEPTADLDAASEAEIIALLPAIFSGRTVILSSHSAAVNALAGQQVAIGKKVKLA
jgi:ATP-binding cassette subfamily C protein CydD